MSGVKFSKKKNKKNWPYIVYNYNFLLKIIVLDSVQTYKLHVSVTKLTASAKKTHNLTYYSIPVQENRKLKNKRYSVSVRNQWSFNDGQPWNWQDNDSSGFMSDFTFNVTASL